MSALVADFEMTYPSGTTIHAAFTSPIDGFFVTTLLGPSGCGKTTILRCLAGLERPARGVIQFRGDRWFHAESRHFLSPRERGIGFLFQEYALFPHQTVSENIGFGLRTLSRPRRAELVGEMLERFQLAGLRDRYPREISGGQQQRVALARALARKPKLLLLDEPLSALDGATREEVRSQLRRILQGFGVPVVLVTHDRIEALALSDRVVAMASGRVAQHGTVEEVFSRPRDAEVARIVGVETVVAGAITRLEDGLATVEVGGITLLALAPPEPCRDVHVCIRGEEVTLQHAPHDDLSVRNQLPGRVTWLVHEGPLVRVGLDCGFALTAVVTRNACQQLRLSEGGPITVGIKTPAIHLAPRREHSQATKGATSLGDGVGA